jgi:hypothetical protein
VALAAGGEAAAVTVPFNEADALNWEAERADDQMSSEELLRAAQVLWPFTKALACVPLVKSEARLHHSSRQFTFPLRQGMRGEQRIQLHAWQVSGMYCTPTFAQHIVSWI